MDLSPELPGYITLCVAQYNTGSSGDKSNFFPEAELHARQVLTVLLILVSIQIAGKIVLYYNLESQKESFRGPNRSSSLVPRALISEINLNI